MLLPSASRISSSLGFGFLRSSPAEAMMKPGVQYPHCEPSFSWNPRCTAESCPPVPSDSMVSMRLPCTVAASVRQESAGLSSMSTVQAPHSPPSQPVLVPVNPSFSRRKSSSKTLSATASVRSRPLSVNSRKRVKRFFPDGAFDSRLIFLQLRHTSRPSPSRPFIGNGWYALLCEPQRGHPPC